MKKFLNKGGKKFNLNKTEKIIKRKLKKNNDEFFVDFALITYGEVFDFDDDEMGFYYFPMCYDEEKYFEDYCNLDLMSKPINAEFDEQQLNKFVIFVDEIVSSEGETIIKVENNTEFYLNSFTYKAINGNSKTITKIANALNAHVVDNSYYYLDGKCSDNKIKNKSIGLKLKNTNTTINVSAKDIAVYSHENKCQIGLENDEKQLKFSLPIFNNYCILFDTYLNQIAFAPKEVKNEDMEWSYC
ncbi:hypothetical protein ACQ4LE_005402 [Meloidogyne hapla]